jgi:hypothetical protein
MQGLNALTCGKRNTAAAAAARFQSHLPTATHTLPRKRRQSVTKTVWFASGAPAAHSSEAIAPAVRRISRRGGDLVLRGLCETRAPLGPSDRPIEI